MEKKHALCLDVKPYQIYDESVLPATPTGSCWCGCGETTSKGSLWRPGHDGDAHSYLVQLYATDRGNDGMANLILSLGFDSTENLLKQACKQKKK